MISNKYFIRECYFLAINILPHTDSFAVFVVKFSVRDKAVFLVKSKNSFIVLNVGIYGKEAGGNLANAQALSYILPFFRAAGKPRQV